MERNQIAVIAIGITGLVAAVALGVVLRGTSDPAVADPEPIAAQGSAARADVKTPVKTKKPTSARAVPEAPSQVDPSSLVATASGLKYSDLEVGNGASPETGQTVVVEYTGWLEDGVMFDSSFKRPDPFKFQIGKGRVIKGWDEGVATMKVGGKRQLVIPSDLGYGEKGAGQIPAGATLIFDVELKDLLAAREAPAAPTKLEDGQFTATESGLKYHDFQVGTGPTPQPGQVVEVDYTGWLKNGTKFDSSLDRASPISFPLGQGRVIKGWDEGVGSMAVGGKRQLVIPADLAYGESGRPPVIPENAVLVFEVELVGVR